MRRFLVSTWFPFVTCVILAGMTVLSYLWLKPDPMVINHSEIAKYTVMGVWAVGPVIGFLSFLFASILNLIRRIVRMRRMTFLHPVVVLLSVGFWVVVGWQLAGEKPYTPIGRAVIEFAARPILLGSLLTCVFVVLMSLPFFFFRKS